jgi:hypothetical protein
MSRQCLCHRWLIPPDFHHHLSLRRRPPFLSSPLGHLAESFGKKMFPGVTCRIGPNGSPLSGGSARSLPYLRPRVDRPLCEQACPHQFTTDATDFVPAHGNGSAAGVEGFLQSLRLHGLPAWEAPPPSHPLLLRNRRHRKIAFAAASGPPQPQGLLFHRHLRSRLYPRNPPKKGQLSVSRSLLHLY